MSEDLLIRGVTVSGVEFDAMAVLATQYLTEPGSLVIIDEAGHIKRILAPVGNGKFILARIDGVIDWWPIGKPFPPLTELLESNDGDVAWRAAADVR